MVRIIRSYRIQVCGTKLRPLASSPRILKDRQASTAAGAMQKAPSQFIVAPRAQASRRCATQPSLGGKAAELCYRFGPLTPSARSANLIAGDGTKNGFPAPNKEQPINQKQTLDTKSPIQVRIQMGVDALRYRRTRFG